MRCNFILSAVLSFSICFGRTDKSYNKFTPNELNDDGLGMLVYNPLCTEFLAGMAGEPGQEASSASTSYVAPIRDEILYKNSIYEYEYYILIGSLEEMRKQVYHINKKLTKAYRKLN